MRYKLKTKPLSVNDARVGKRFKTIDYKTYEVIIKALLPKSIEIKDPKSMELFMKR